MKKELVYGDGYLMGVPAGIYQAIHRIEDMLGSGTVSVDTLLDYLKKDASWAMQHLDGWDGVQMMDDANGWKPGWWNRD